jgi:diguanylate cyclase (GGDEF)-like protein/PAS domain S-box-containing protein
VENKLFEDLFVKNPLPMWLFDTGTLRFVEVNQAAVTKYGWSRNEFLLMSLNDIRPAEDLTRLQAHLENPRADDGSYRRSPGWRHVTKDGTTIWVDIYSYDWNYGDHPVRLVQVHDITDFKNVSERLNEQSTYFRQLFENSPEAIVMLDNEDRVVHANGAFQMLFQYSNAELNDRRINEIIVPEERHDEATTLSLTALGSVPARLDTIRRKKDGALIEVAALGFPVSVDGRNIGVFAIYRDVTESKRIANALAYHSTHDPLTGLINRHEFERCTREFLHRASRSSRGHAMVYFDLDQFKLVNEGSGHEAGDRLIIELAEVIREQLPPSATIGRMGGDEFAALLPGFTLEEATGLAQRTIEALRSHRFRWDDRSYAITASAGVVEVGREVQSLMALLSAADAACYTAKELGRGRVQVYRPEDQDLKKTRGELSWATRIMDALERDRFVLYHQRIVPVVPPADGSVRLRYEVLVRMRDDQGQLVLPGLFVPAAERYGLMPAIDRRVISRVFAQLRARKEAGREPDALVTINLSGVSLGEEGFMAFIKDQLARSGISPQNLCFEITETSAIANLSRALTFISDMRALGGSIALDDFGSGMSSFNYLKSLNVDYLKIDGGFVRDIPNSPLDCAMAEAIARIGKVKGITTIAECVETPEALAKLREIGVDYAQGHLIHYPEPWEIGVGVDRPSA